MMKQSTINNYRGLIVTGVMVLGLSLSGCGESESDRLVKAGHSEAYAEGHVDGCRSSRTGVIKRHDKRYSSDEEYKKAWDDAYASCGKSADTDSESAAPTAEADPAATPAASGDTPAKSE